MLSELQTLNNTAGASLSEDTSCRGEPLSKPMPSQPTSGGLSSGISSLQMVSVDVSIYGAAVS